MIRRRHIKSILVGILAMILGLIALAEVLVGIMLISHREIAVGPVYLLIPIVTFTAGCYWSLRRSSQSRAPAELPSKATIIAKSVMVGVTAMIVSVPAYLFWILLRIPRNIDGAVGIDVLSVIHWPVLLGIFLAGFILEYRHASRRRLTPTERL